jgi:phosphatidylserine/phosphatidylglycerophosphate/cardiolipin synthase-like enzyme
LRNMKLPLLITVFLLVSTFVQAQNTISDARKQMPGTEVAVSGVVTNGSELGSIRYLQDETAGIAIYDLNLNALQRGDSISVTGVLDEFNNLIEITEVSSLTVHQSESALPSPKLITIDKIGEDFEAQLVVLENLFINNPGGSFAGNANYEFSDGTKSGVFRINSSSPLVGKPVPAKNFNLVSICSQYSTIANDLEHGYQLLPRDSDDIILGSVVNFTSPIQVVDITKDAVVLGWSTNEGATPYVRYGNFNDADSLKNIKVGDSTTSEEINWHQAGITNLEPSEVIYAQPFMVLEGDTVFAGIQAYSTESNSTGAIRVYFNTEADQDLATFTPAMNIGDFMEDTLTAYINRARESIDLCIYNFNNETISDALNAANQRGVKIRVITCGSTQHVSTNYLSDNIPVLERPETSGDQKGIMHNKFAIFDAGHPNANKAWIWSGSTNLTPGQLYADANNMIFIQDQSLAKVYTIEFEEMWGSSEYKPNESNVRFGEAKADNTPHEFLIGGNRVECYFSPSDQTNQKLIDAMASSDYNLNVETMLITRSDLARAIIAAHERGVKVHVLTDFENTNSDYVNEALNNALPAGKFVFDDISPLLNHHKVAIIDADNEMSDPQVITGSHNWSNSANEINDENTLIIHNADVANQYLQQFAYRFEQNNGDFVVSAQLIENSELSVYPNPSAGKITVSSDHFIKSVQLFNLNGALLQQWEADSQKTLTFSLPSEITGMYLLKVKNGNGTISICKIVKY